MAFSPSAVLSLLVLTTVLQLSIGLLIGIKDLRGGGNNVRMEEDVPVKDILKKLPLVRVPVGTVLTKSGCCQRTKERKGRRQSLPKAR